MTGVDFSESSIDYARNSAKRSGLDIKPGGKVLLDVFSMEKYEAFREGDTWELNPDGGFWREQGYVVLNRFSKFTEDVTLEQVAVISEQDTAVYYLWNQYFTKEILEREAIQCGFRVSGVYGDVAGRTYDGTGDTIAVLLEKP